MNLGTNKIKGIYVGSTPAALIYVGTAKVWPEAEPEPVGDWLCFTAEQNGSTLRLDKSGSPAEIYIETSTNGSNWSDYEWSGNTGDTLTLANVGNKVYFRAKTENQTIGNSTWSYYKFSMTGKIAASGNIQTLLKADGSRTDAPAYCYIHMFDGCTSLTTAPTLPATTLNQRCYLQMFQRCKSLTTAPEIPAITVGTYSCSDMFKYCSSLTTPPTLLPAMSLNTWSYNGMFSQCTALTASPALPATTLATFCYSYIFENCRSLTIAPALPAMTLVNGCYNYMFTGCTSLTTAPALPAMTLVNECYKGMFDGCTSLSSMEVAFTGWTNGATNNWLNNVAASGTFTCPAELSDTRDSSHIPTGWTKVDAT